MADSGREADPAIPVDEDVVNTAGNDAASAPESNTALAHTLDAMVLERMRPTSAALGLLFVAFAIYNIFDPWLPLSAAELGQLTLANVVLIAFFALLYGMLRNGMIPERRAHPLVGTSVAAMLAHTLFSLEQAGDLFYTHYLVVLLIGIGSVVLSFRWHLVCSVGTYVAWAAVAYPIGGANGLLRFSFVLLAAGAISTAFVLYRVSSHRRLLIEIGRRRAMEDRLSEANQRLEDLSQRDPLTNLFNRRGVFDRLEVELSRTARGHGLALLLIDLDGFKAVNDRYGHVEGDRLLQAVAEALRRGTRSSDAVCRWGGDEFLVILADTKEDDAVATAERLVTRVRDVGVQLFPASPVTASGGLALAKPGDSPLVLVERADQGVYEVKRGGGNRVLSAA